MPPMQELPCLSRSVCSRLELAGESPLGACNRTQSEDFDGWLGASLHKGCSAEFCCKDPPLAPFLLQAQQDGEGLSQSTLDALSIFGAEEDSLSSVLNIACAEEEVATCLPSSVLTELPAGSALRYVRRARAFNKRRLSTTGAADVETCE
mmetsp:Transcript_88857/g.162914  ORF Transcript_88857/g.162914 Transcript_88857/m.162914 type:complete len:150 (+) Transcript_88857:115-564(+)